MESKWSYLRLPQNRLESTQLVGALIYGLGSLFRVGMFLFPVFLFLPWIIPLPFVLEFYENIGIKEFWEAYIIATTMTLGFALLLVLVPLFIMSWILHALGTGVIANNRIGRFIASCLALLMIINIAINVTYYDAQMTFAAFLWTIACTATAILLLLPAPREAEVM